MFGTPDRQGKDDIVPPQSFERLNFQAMPVSVPDQRMNLEYVADWLESENIDCGAATQ